MYIINYKFNQFICSNLNKSNLDESIHYAHSVHATDLADIRPYQEKIIKLEAEVKKLAKDGTITFVQDIFNQTSPQAKQRIKKILPYVIFQEKQCEDCMNNDYYTVSGNLFNIIKALNGYSPDFRREVLDDSGISKICFSFFDYYISASHEQIDNHFLEEWLNIWEQKITPLQEKPQSGSSCSTTVIVCSIIGGILLIAGIIITILVYKNKNKKTVEE